MLQFFSQIGNNIQHTAPYTGQQNGVAKMKNWVLKEMTMCMLESKDLAANIWAESMNGSSYIHNRFPHS